jgi:hypothetical protein
MSLTGQCPQRRAAPRKAGEPCRAHNECQHNDHGSTTHRARLALWTAGSTTGDCLPSVGPSMFNRTAVADPNFDSWYSQVTALPRLGGHALTLAERRQIQGVTDVHHPLRDDLQDKRGAHG